MVELQSSRTSGCTCSEMEGCRASLYPLRPRLGGHAPYVLIEQHEKMIELRKLQLLELSLLQEFRRICEKNGLTWYFTG